MPILYGVACASAAFFTASWIPLVALFLGLSTLAVLRKRVGWVPLGILVASLLLPGWLLWKAVRPPSPEARDSVVIRELVDVEERILALAPQLGELSEGLMNLHLPDRARENRFAGMVSTAGEGAHPAPLPREGLWRPLLDEVAWFEHAALYLVDGRFVDEAGRRFEGKVGFRGLARMRDGRWSGLKSSHTVTWTKQGEAGDAPWLITAWESGAIKEARSDKRFFRESLEEALRRPADRALARRSPHHEAAIEFYRGGATNQPHPYFAPISANQKPGLAVVDIDSDGDDDIYVTVRIGRNLLFENQGDGTFLEAAEKYGIHFTGHCTCALFADFDNDGDPDLFVGRSLRPSLYFENRAGYFYPGPRENEFPMTAISASAADFNGDGLLDVYLLTYRPATLDDRSSPSGGVAGKTERWPDHFYPPELAKEYYRRHRESRGRDDPEFPNLLNQIGPPNVLFVNRGNGRFEVAAENAALGIWRNSLQATWADFDRDGDPDVFVANDWAPDNLFRNDGPSGFTDVTEEAGITSFGFAMGATWGDYDNDGRQDLYVSNMFSKAGRRITGRLPEIAKIYRESAAGNYLYRHGADHRFTQVAGPEPPDLAVDKAGWSWGGQFADFDNDGFLDLYVLSGYFTAPEPVSSALDL